MSSVLEILSVSGCSVGWKSLMFRAVNCHDRLRPAKYSRQPTCVARVFRQRSASVESTVLEGATIAALFDRHCDCLCLTFGLQLPVFHALCA